MARHCHPLHACPGGGGGFGPPPRGSAGRFWGPGRGSARVVPPPRAGGGGGPPPRPRGGGAGRARALIETHRPTSTAPAGNGRGFFMTISVPPERHHLRSTGHDE